MKTTHPAKTNPNREWQILIIEDDEEDFLIAREMLNEARGRKYEVFWANSYEAGKQQLISDHYSAVLVDYDLGSRSGIDLIREANEWGYPAPLILFTGRGNYEVDLEAMEAGATLYLAKGEANPLLLERAIRYAIELKQKERSLRENELELRRQSEALRVSEERFEKAFNASPNAQVISRMEDGQIELINDSFEQLFGVNRAEVIGKTSTELNMFANPADRQKAVQRLQTEQRLRDYEIEIRASSGEIRHALLSIEFISIDSNRFMLTVIQDITGRYQAEEALRRSEAHFRALVSASMHVLYRMSPDWAEMILLQGGGYLADTDKPNRDWMAQYIPLEEQDRVKAAIHQAVQSGTVFELEHRVLRQDGTIGSVASRAVPERNKAGEIIEWFGAASDITERKRAEEALLETQNRLLVIMESIADGVYALDRELRITYVSDVTLHYFRNRPREKIIGHPIDEFFPQIRGTIFEKAFHQALSGGEPVHVEAPSVITDQFMEVHVYPGPDNLTVLFRNITNRHQMETELREQEEVLRLALAAGKAGAWSWDLTTQSVKWSDEYYRIFGFEPGSITPSAEAGLSRVHPEDRPRLEALLKEAKEQGKPIDEVHRVLWPDGSVHWVRGISNTFFDPQDKPYRMAGIAIEVTEQKKAETALAEYAEHLTRSNEDLENFAYIASHDLQEPLRKIKYFGQTLQKTLRGQLDETSGNYLQRMIKAIGRMQAMIQALLDLARVNRQDQTFQVVDLATAAAEAVSDLELSIRQTRGNVRVEPLPSIEADPSQIHLVFLNLIGNALKYHKPNVPPSVKVSSETLLDPRTKDPKVVIRVQDNGIGFEEAQFEEMLQPFRRLHGKEEYEGTGIGLAIVKKIIDRHEGEITAHSKPGEGSTFFITLPVHRRGREPHSG